MGFFASVQMINIFKFLVFVCSECVTFVLCLDIIDMNFGQQQQQHQCASFVSQIFHNFSFVSEFRSLHLRK